MVAVYDEKQFIFEDFNHSLSKFSQGVRVGEAQDMTRRPYTPAGPSPSLGPLGKAFTPMPPAADMWAAEYFIYKI